MTAMEYFWIGNDSARIESRCGGIPVSSIQRPWAGIKCSKVNPNLGDSLYQLPDGTQFEYRYSSGSATAFPSGELQVVADCQQP